VGGVNALRYMTALVSCLMLAGCGGGKSVREGSVRAAPPAAARARADAPPPPDLRIPASAVAKEIPVVPVPPVPLGRGADPTPPAPALPAPPAAVILTSVEGPAPSAPAVASPSPAPTDSQAKPASLRQLQQDGAAWYAGVDSYIVRLTRREQVGGEAKPEEIMLFKFRKEPWSVYFKWVGKVGHDREVIYVKGQYGNQIHTRLAAGDAPFMPAGHTMALAVDSSLVRSASRHSITEAGIGSCVERFGQLLDAQDRGDRSHGTVTDLGVQNRREFSQPVRGAEQIIPPGAETELPKGGRRHFYFDAEHHLPMLVITYDNRNQEVEYYLYDRLEAPVHLDAADFDPNKLWNNPNPARKSK
jgi:hypothetical protein